MQFNETIKQLGYKVCERDEESILIVKEDALANIYFFFDIKLKQLTGCIRTQKPIYNLDEIARHYTIFRQMRKDLKTLQQLSKYDIIE